ncbi:neuronal acetylcholine receptor subunit beta-3-like [Branchiostoma lanceolatum]|uniref:neuronal acetylcholine receptor subunit beta-3-like n=1 Tax=Branchiostoma lanceolatum TaxID=7740 RepID=UPI0034522A97
MADEQMKNQFPACDLFPSPQHGCWNSEPETRNNEVCYHGSGANYRGTWSKTTSGADCVQWAAVQTGFYTPWANLDNNYCRNPTGLIQPFCMTEDGSQEECDVVPCNVDVCWDMGQPDHGIRSPDKRFYYVLEKVTYTCDEGYTLDSRHTSNIRCFEGGIWQYDKPSCSVDMRGRLEEDVLDGYSQNQAPDGHTVISFNGSVEQIVDLDEKKELLVASIVIDFVSGPSHDTFRHFEEYSIYAWRDNRLKWRPQFYENIEALSVPGSSIWTPTFTVKKNADRKYKGLPKDVPLLITTDGTVTWKVSTLTSTLCDADPFLFPADIMECHICFSASSAAEQTIECGEGISCEVWSPQITEGEWYRKNKIFAQGDKEACFAVHLERIPLFHIATTVGPCVILVVLMTITFVMPVDRGDRISFGVTIQLSMVVSLVFVTEVLPVKGALPFLATLIVVCMALMGLFLFFTMGIIRLHDREGSLSPMAKTFFLRYMAKFLLLGDLTEKNAGSDDGEPVLINRKLIFSYDNKALVDEESPADVSEATRQPSPPPTRLEVAVSSGFGNVIRGLEELAKAVKNEQEVSDYTLLAKVLDRLCLVLYVISVGVAVPMTMYLSK